MAKDSSQGSRGSKGLSKGFASRMACALSLGLLLTLGVSAQQPDQQQQQDPQQGQAQQQDQSAQPQSQGDSSQAQGQSQDQPPPPAASAPQDQPPAQPQDQAPPPPPAKKPKYAPQDANRPPYSNDYPAPAAGAPAHAPSPDQYDPDQDLPPGQQGQPGAQGSQGAPDGGPGTYGPPQNRPPYDNGNPNSYGRPQNAPYTRNAAPAAPPPATLTIPAGTVLSVRINEYLSSDRNQVGDRVTAMLQQTLVVGGYVVARRGQMLVGQVEAAQKAGRVTGTSQLGIELGRFAADLHAQAYPVHRETRQAFEDPICDNAHGKAFRGRLEFCMLIRLAPITICAGR